MNDAARIRHHAAAYAIAQANVLVSWRDGSTAILADEDIGDAYASWYLSTIGDTYETATVNHTIAFPNWMASAGLVF